MKHRSIGCGVTWRHHAIRTIRRVGPFAIVCAVWSVCLLTAEASTQRFFIQEYQIKGAHHLTRMEIEEAVYPYLGPGRTTEDVEKARAALEKEYQAKGYQTVSVQIPMQPWRDGSI